MVHVRTNPDQGSLWSSEASLVTVLNLLQIGILDYKSQLDLVDCSLGIVSPWLLLSNELFHWFS